jgi:hypothetical protein
MSSDWEGGREFCSLVRFRLCGMELLERRDAVTRPLVQDLGNLMLYPAFPLILKEKLDALWR